MSIQSPKAMNFKEVKVPNKAGLSNGNLIEIEHNDILVFVKDTSLLQNLKPLILQRILDINKIAITISTNEVNILEISFKPIPFNQEAENVIYKRQNQDLLVNLQHGKSESVLPIGALKFVSSRYGDFKIGIAKLAQTHPDSLVVETDENFSTYIPNQMLETSVLKLGFFSTAKPGSLEVLAPNCTTPFVEFLTKNVVLGVSAKNIGYLRAVLKSLPVPSFLCLHGQAVDLTCTKRDENVDKCTMMHINSVESFENVFKDVLRIMLAGTGTTSHHIITVVGNAMLNVGMVEQFRKFVHATVNEDFMLDHAVTSIQA